MLIELLFINVFERVSRAKVRVGGNRGKIQLQLQWRLFQSLLDFEALRLLDYNDRLCKRNILPSVLNLNRIVTLKSVFLQHLQRVPN